jgi:hypothetical protein
MQIQYLFYILILLIHGQHFSQMHDYIKNITVSDSNIFYETHVFGMLIIIFLNWSFLV